MEHTKNGTRPKIPPDRRRAGHTAAASLTPQSRHVSFTFTFLIVPPPPAPSHSTARRIRAIIRIQAGGSGWAVERRGTEVFRHARSHTRTGAVHNPSPQSRPVLFQPPDRISIDNRTVPQMP
ncbi:hypothetical protein J6590_024508 [Homalodisca vitripennis]|nr:hypothetical protein J6590_024508 [Homalodisca vitripennis]